MFGSSRGIDYIASRRVGWGGGALAWSLGHQHFSPKDRDAEYMGVHITLAGIRGVMGPILGVQLYIWFIEIRYANSGLLNLLYHLSSDDHRRSLRFRTAFETLAAS